MSDIVLNRASSTIDVNDFTRLTKLHLDYKWLTYEPQALFELWCLTENDDQKDIIEFLIKNFSYINEHSLSEGSLKIAATIESTWKLSAKDTFLTATCDDRKPDGSQTLIQSLKNKFSINWRELNFFNSLPISINEIPSDSNIVLVDDFIGTGDTISRKLKYVNDTIEKRGLKNITVKIVSLAAMNFTQEVLNGLKVDYFSPNWLKKGISELVPTEKRDAATKSMEELEKKLKKQYKGKPLPYFGYKKSESLYALGSHNIPNNVFPIFWWPFLKGGIQRKTLFKRV
jgi:hypoxanthine phosphoribosyltransferase